MWEGEHGDPITKMTGIWTLSALRALGTLGSNTFESFISEGVNFICQLERAQGAQILG